MLEMTPDYIMKNMLFFEGRSPGICPKNKMRAQNLAPEGLTPEWRISEQSLVRYLKRNGVQFYTRGYA
jgi:hypothetical protein